MLILCIFCDTMCLVERKKKIFVIHSLFVKVYFYGIFLCAELLQLLIERRFADATHIQCLIEWYFVLSIQPHSLQHRLTVRNPRSAEAHASCQCRIDPLSLPLANVFSLVFRGKGQHLQHQIGDECSE